MHKIGVKYDNILFIFSYKSDMKWVRLESPEVESLRVADGCMDNGERVRLACEAVWSAECQVAYTHGRWATRTSHEMQGPHTYLHYDLTLFPYNNQQGATLHTPFTLWSGRQLDAPPQVMWPHPIWRCTFMKDTQICTHTSSWSSTSILTVSMTHYYILQSYLWYALFNTSYTICVISIWWVQILVRYDSVLLMHVPTIHAIL